MKKLIYLCVAIGLAFCVESCKGDPCEDVKCNNGGTCAENAEGEAECTCLNGYSGATCNVADSCITENVDCGENGTCENGKCKCKPYYRGEVCEDKCVRGKYESGTCTCDQGIEGISCEGVSRRKFCGIYTLTNHLGGTSGALTATVDSSNFDDTEVWKVVITNLSSKGDASGYAEIDGDKITVPTQTVLGSDGSKWQVRSITSGTWDSVNKGFIIEMGRRAFIGDSLASEQSKNYTYKM